MQEVALELDLSQVGEGRVIAGKAMLQWVVHTEREPYRLTRFTASERGGQVRLVTSGGTGWDATESSEFQAIVDITPEADGLRCRAEVQHPEKARVLKTVVQGLPQGTLRTVAPDGGQRVGARHRSAQYPGEWPTTVVWLKPDDGAPRFVARCVAEPVARKAFSARVRPSGDTELMLYEEARATRYGEPLRGSLWRLAFGASHLAELEAHGREMGQARGLRPFEERQDASEWERHCNLVVKLHGTDFNGQMHLDYRGMQQAVRRLARYGDLSHAILHLVGWDGPYMRRCPRLAADAAMGGDEGLRGVVQAAHGLGAKVILHTSPAAASAEGAREHGLLQCQGRNLHGDAVMYPAWDYDQDGFAETGLLLMNLSFPEYRGWHVERCRQLVEQFGVDGFFLADSHLYASDSRGDCFAGWQALVADLRGLRDDLVLVAEGSADYISSLTPLFEPKCRVDSPEFQMAVGRWGRSIAYSGAADSRNHAGVRELMHAQYRPLKGVSRNVVPSVAITRDTMLEGMDDVLAGLEWARDWQALYNSAPAEGTHPEVA